MAINPSDVDSDPILAKRIIAIARSIAPSIDSLTGPSLDEATAILTGIATEARTRGARGLANQRVGTASVSWGSSADWFTDEDRAALRALTGFEHAGHPSGIFPASSRTLDRVWPEEAEPCT